MVLQIRTIKRYVNWLCFKKTRHSKRWILYVPFL